MFVRGLPYIARQLCEGSREITFRKRFPHPGANYRAGAHNSHLSAYPFVDLYPPLNAPVRPCARARAAAFNTLEEFSSRSRESETGEMRSCIKADRRRNGRKKGGAAGAGEGENITQPPVGGGSARTYFWCCAPRTLVAERALFARLLP